MFESFVECKSGLFTINFGKQEYHTRIIYENYEGHTMIIKLATRFDLYSFMAHSFHIWQLYLSQLASIYGNVV